MIKKDSYYLDLESKGYYDTIDKRSKDYREYKEWKSSKYEELKENIEKKPKGLGDTVAKVTKALKIDKAVEWLAGEDCGCKERQEALNKLFSFSKVNCISEDDYVFLTEFFAKKGKLVYYDRVRLLQIHSHIFNLRFADTTCKPCLQSVVKTLKKYLENYK